MRSNYYKELIEKADFSYAKHKIVSDSEGKAVDYLFLDVNKSFEELLGLKKTDIVGKHMSKLLPGNNSLDFDWMKAYKDISLKNEEKKVIFERYFSSLKKWYKIEIFSDDNCYFTTIFFDVTEKNTIKELNYFFDINLNLLCLSDKNGKLIKLNQNWEKILGYSLDELMETNFSGIIHPEDAEDTSNFFKLLNKSGKILNFVNRCRTKDGDYKYIEWCSSVKNNIIYTSAKDVSERVEAERKLKKLSIIDPLTGIYNKRYISDRLSEIENKYKRVKENFSVALLDLDRFKRVNDIYGHLAGDHILREFSKSFKNSIRPFDLFGRFGGEEFILVLLNCTKKDAEKKMESIFDEIRNKNFLYKDFEIKITASCGISDNKDLENMNITKLIDIADKRLYMAKDQGRDKIVIKDK